VGGARFLTLFASYYSFPLGPQKRQHFGQQLGQADHAWLLFQLYELIKMFLQESVLEHK